MLRKQAQTTLEYVIILTCIMGALLFMQPYVQKSIQGRLRGVSGVLVPRPNDSVPRVDVPSVGAMKVSSDNLSEEKLNFGIASGWRTNYAYSRGNTIGSTQTQTLIQERAKLQNNKIATENITQKVTQRQEFVLPK